MFGLSKAISSLGIQFLILYGLIPDVHPLECRNGIENSVAYVYWQKTCSASETACFQSVKCTKIGDTPYQDFEWRCIDGNKCVNATGQSTAQYKGIKGICCFTNNCNAYKGPCTDSASIPTPKWTPLALMLALVYLLLTA